MPDNPISDMTAIERALVALRRSQQRRNLARSAESRGERADDERLPDAVLELLDAVESAADRGASLTVTDAAAALGVDQPRSSRLAGQALDAGLLRREADQSDGRRSLLVLTDAGRAALARVHDVRHRAIARAIAHWPAEDQDAFARLLPRFVQDFAALSERERT
ncbi:MarR family winged helix-turn-helix transcriptional regulator [Streptomyces sp. ST1020]